MTSLYCEITITLNDWWIRFVLKKKFKMIEIFLQLFDFFSSLFRMTLLEKRHVILLCAYLMYEPLLISPTLPSLNLWKRLKKRWNWHRERSREKQRENFMDKMELSQKKSYSSELWYGSCFYDGGCIILNGWRQTKKKIMPPPPPHSTSIRRMDTTARMV